jgi:S1-C subfamily serine protease
MSTPLQDFSEATSALVARFTSSTVSVRGRRARSSGFVWRSGLIVTADDALAESGEITVTLPGGTSLPAQIAGRDPTTDVALLRVEDPTLQPAPLTADVPPLGTVALAVGATDGFATAALGIVSLSGGRWQSMRGGEIDSRLELDVRLRNDGEGSLAVTADGRAFGMTVFGPRRRVLVIPSATIANVAAKLEKDGRVSRGYLGLGLHPVDVEAGGGAGAIVMSVDPEGPGAAAGIHQGDVLVTWDGQPIERLRPLIRALGPQSVGRTLSLDVRRGGATHQAKVQIGERPPA